MFRALTAVSLIGFGFCSLQLEAEEQVTLKSGARLIGSVSLNGQTVNVRIGDSQLAVPLNEVELIAPVGTESKQSSERMLMIALESRAQQGSSAGQVGLLSEAYRQAPDDARIAFWYAQSLADAGFGNAANAVLQKHYVAIDQAFPGIITRLTDEIRERIALESLPADMRAKMDQINNSAGTNLLPSDRLPMYVRFRLTDSAGQPVGRAAIQVSCNGDDERLEAYENGFYLLSFNSRGNDDPNCKLTVNSPGLESKEFDLQPSAGKVANAGELVVKRYGDDDKMPLTILVADGAGKSVKDALVTLRPQNRDDESAVQTTSTDADGRANFEAFPMKYTYTVTVKGFKSESGAVELKQDFKQQDAQRVKLYPAIAASIRLAWWTTSPSGENVSNEAVIDVGEEIPPMPFRPDMMALLRPVQYRDKLVLQHSPQFWGAPMGLSTPWVRRAPADLLGESPLQFFKELDVQRLDDVQDKWAAVDMSAENVRGGPHPPFSFPVQQGEIYAGQMPGRDPRTGQPTLVSFKVFIEKMTTGSKSQ